MNAFQIRIDNNLPVVAQVHGFQLIELLAPLLHVRNVRPVTRQIISRAKMDQNFSTRIGCYHLYVFRVSEIDFTQLAGVARATRVELPHQIVVTLHARGTGGERLTRVHTSNDGEGVFPFSTGREFHQRSASVDERYARPYPGKCNWSSFVDLYAEAVRHETHYAGRLDPGNLLKLRFALCQRNKENIAADIAAHDFHDLGLGDVLGACDFNLVAGVDSEAPRVFAVTIKRARHRHADAEHKDGQGNPLQTIGGVFGERCATGGNALLSAEER